MDKQRMIFNIDRRTITEGDVVSIEWDCTSAESVSLTLDNGFSSNDIPLDIAGAKKFRLNRSKGRTRFTIAATMGGKVYRKQIAVRVKKMPVTRAETVDHRGRTVGGLRLWWQGLVTKWRSTRLMMAYRMLPEKKQLAFLLMMLFSLMFLIGLFWPPFVRIGSLLLMGYLAYVMLKR